MKKKLVVPSRELGLIKQAAVDRWTQLSGDDEPVVKAYLYSVVNHINKELGLDIEIDFAERKLPSDYAVEE